MHKVLNILLILCATAFLMGCATSGPVIIKAHPVGDQSLKYDKGGQIFISRKEYSRAGVVLPLEAIQPGKPIDFYIFIANYYSYSFNFSVGNIHAKCDKKSIYVYYPEEALRDQDKRTDISAPNLAGLTPADVRSLSPQIAKYYQRKNKELREFALNLLRAQTIAPNSTHEGIVRVSFPTCKNKLELSIETGEEIHLLKFDIIKK